MKKEYAELAGIGLIAGCAGGIIARLIFRKEAKRIASTICEIDRVAQHINAAMIDVRIPGTNKQQAAFVIKTPMMAYKQ